jgi:hypothetical protein
MTVFDRPFSLGLRITFLVAIAACGGSTPAADASIQPSPSSAQFEAVSVDWRISQGQKTVCRYYRANECTPSTYVVHSYTAHGIFRNTGRVRGSGLVTFYGWHSNNAMKYPTPTQPDRYECSAVIPETAPGGVVEASCPINELSELGPYDSVEGSKESGGKAPGYKVG